MHSEYVLIKKHLMLSSVSWTTTPTNYYLLYYHHHVIITVTTIYIKFKLHRHCSNNQAKQIAILKVLQELEELQVGQDNDKCVAIYTKSKITLDLLQNTFTQKGLTESIRNKTIMLMHFQWIIHFGWVKGHTGIARNELVDRLAKAAAVEDGPVV
jgi:ribonuclease HI